MSGPSSPSVVGANPADKSTGIVLGTSIVVTFDQPIDQTTVSSATFSLFGPGTTDVLTPDALLATTPKLTTTSRSVPGTFHFALNSSSNTVLTFTPTLPLRPNVVYTVTIVGPTSVAGSSVKGTNGATLDSNYVWTFTTGDLDLSVPPVQSPLALVLPLDPASIQIKQRIFPVGNDLAQELQFIFPANIDPNSFSLSDILMSLEPILGDLSVSVPTGLTTSASISVNILTVQISGWPAS